MHEKLKKLLEQRASVWDGTMKPLVEKNELTPDEAVKYDEAERNLDSIEAEIGRVERAIEREAEESRAVGRRAELLSFAKGGEIVTPEQVLDADARYEEIFKKFVVRGLSRLNSEEREILEANRSPLEERALTHNVGASGGFTVPEGFVNTMVDARNAFGGLRGAGVTQITTTEGNDLPIPTGSDTGNSGELLGVNVTATEADPTFGQVVLKSWIWSSKMVRVPFALLQDGAFDLDTWLPKKLGERLGRAQAGYFVTGTGSSQPEGILTNVTTGWTTAGAQTTTFKYDDFVELEHSVNVAYRPSAEYLISDSALKAARKILDLNGLPIWTPGMVVGAPSTINGYKYTVDVGMPTVAASNKPVVFGDLSYYWVRDVSGAIVMRLEERYAEFGQVAFLSWMRMDARPATAGDNPYKALAMAAS